MGRLFVIVATVGRAALTRETVALLAQQTRPPDGVIVVGASPADIDGVDTAGPGVETVIAPRGSCHQRNRGLDLVRDRADTAIFFDDDFVPAPTYFEQVERIFAEQKDVVGITGELVADGIHLPTGIPLAEAQALIEDRAATQDPSFRPREALYGCNMAIRLSAAEGLRFDEQLPLYAWLEDIDYTIQLARRGRLVSTGLVTGVHLGAKSGRTSGRRLGYSQIANVIYLGRKGTMQPGMGWKNAVKNVSVNMIKSVRPEPHIDRRGRLIGNALAIGDWLRGRVDPRRIETF